MTTTIAIRPAGPDEYDSLAEFFHLMWLDNGMTQDDFIEDWKASTLEFMRETETANQGRAFVADAGGTLAGGAQCLISRKLYPRALKPSVRQDGYMWGAYVKPQFRRQGLATRLTEACRDYLKSIGCTRMVLHASPGGRPVYAALGFHDTNEMRMAL